MLFENSLCYNESRGITLLFNTLHLENMGVIADGLRDVLQKMKESDERLQARIDSHVAESSRLLDELKETIEPSN